MDRRARPDQELVDRLGMSSLGPMYVRPFAAVNNDELICTWRCAMQKSVHSAGAKFVRSRIPPSRCLRTGGFLMHVRADGFSVASPKGCFFWMVEQAATLPGTLLSCPVEHKEKNVIQKAGRRRPRQTTLAPLAGARNNAGMIRRKACVRRSALGKPARGFGSASVRFCGSMGRPDLG